MNQDGKSATIKLGSDRATGNDVKKAHASIFKTLAECFIPLRHGDLVAKLIHKFEFQGSERTEYVQLCDRLSAIFHIEHLTALLHVEELYEPLDPDSELVRPPYDEKKLRRRTDRLFDSISQLLFSAHYMRLSREEMKTAIEMSSQWGAKLEVDFELFDRLEVFARGYRLVEITRRRWQNFFREEKVKLPEFHRLVIAFRLKGKDLKDSEMRADEVYLKNFKNIPETDLEILLPGSKVRLSTLDRGKILLPTISGVALTIYKLMRVAAVLAVATAVAWAWHWALLIGGLSIYIFKSFLGYARTKDKYQFDLTRNLYLKNLDNNAGVLYRIINEAEEQEICETILGYTILWKQAGESGITGEELDRLAEAFLNEYTGAKIDFDLHDALGKLARLGLARTDEAGYWSAIPISQAPEILSQNWIQLFERQQRRAFAGDIDLDEELAND